MSKQYFQTAGISTYVNPLLTDGQLIHATNVISFPYGAKSKRTGYSTFLGTADGTQVNSLLAFSNIGNDSTKTNLFRASGSALYHSLQGTGAWTLSGNGTISAGAHFGAAILDNVFIGGDAVGSTRHSTNGTSFTNTTLAPIAGEFEQYQGRIYAAGTESTLFYSSHLNAIDWVTSGTSDSSSFEIPGEGKMGKIFKSADKLIATKSTGLMYKWDGYSLIDMSTRYGPSSPYSVAETEDYRFFVNQIGHFGYGGAKPQLLSNAIQRQFYNDANTGIAGTAFATIPAICHRYDYLASVGNITDDFTDRTITNAIIKYDYQKNEYLNWSFADKPTAWLSYNDTDGVKQLIFGDANGQCYQMDNTVFTDNGDPIHCEMVFVFTYGQPEFEKKWNWWRGVFNPGCQAKVQVACSNVFTYENLKWFDLGDVSSGAVEFRFPPESQSRFLFVRIYESSTNSKMNYYGCSISAAVEAIE
uniref:Uncharacterized protein n=2 Tax=viral metagenome TaxID=1070528 RepID=A0A6M3K814_9ZZZZ